MSEFSKFSKMKNDNTKIVATTAYDASFAKLIHKAELDTVLVGDSLGMVIQGSSSTRAVTVDDIAYHVECVRKGAPNLHVMADMPFGSYEGSPDLAFITATELISAGADMVKLEGGEIYASTIEFIVERGIPVCGHVGLLPQTAIATSMSVKGKDKESAARIANDAKCISEAGVSTVVLEMIPSALARDITQEITAATIGIGAGCDCDGQILVLYDLLGIYPKLPSFSKNFLADSGGSILKALQNYVKEVREEKFPQPPYIPV